MNSLEEVFNAFDGLTVLVIGDIMLDSYIWGSVDRISPEAPVPIVRVRKRDFRLGGAANVALNVQALGAKPILCALIGDDDAGNKLLDCLDQQAFLGFERHHGGTACAAAQHGRSRIQQQPAIRFFSIRAVTTVTVIDQQRTDATVYVGPAEVCRSRTAELPVRTRTGAAWR